MLTSRQILNIKQAITGEAVACDAPHNDDHTRAARRDGARRYWYGYTSALLVWDNITPRQYDQLRDHVINELC